MKKKALEKALRKWMTDYALAAWERIADSHLLTFASSLAFTTILQIIPLLALSFAVFQAFGGIEKLGDELKPFILNNLAQGTSDDVVAKLDGFLNNAHARALGVTGFVGGIVTGISLLSSVDYAINSAWDRKITRGWPKRIGYYLVILLIGPMAAAVALGALSSLNFGHLHLVPTNTGLYLIWVTALTGIYKFVPCCPVRWTYALLTSAIVSAVWNCARLGYGLYLRDSMIYHQIYGGVAAVPILLIWVYITWVIILGGAVFTSLLQKRHGVPA
jgi:membrane protein